MTRLPGKVRDSMRVLMIVRKYHPLLGGTERQAKKLSVRLIELGVKVRLVTGWWVRGTPRQEVLDAIPIFRNFTCWEMFGVKGLRKFGGYIYILSLFWYLWKHRHEYDLIHVHMLSYPAFPAVLAGRWLGKKTIIKIANSGPGSDVLRMRKNDLIPGQRQMLPVALGATQMVAVNQRIVDELPEAGVPPERVMIIPNGVELDNLDYKRDYALNGMVTLVFVGRLIYQKGLDVLLPAFKEVVCSRPNLQWRLWLLGEGDLRPELEHKAAELNLTQDVKFWGRVNNVPDFLSQTDIFVLPSRAEGMSNALLEAMAHGLPCVASRISGNTDLIQHGTNGLLVEPGCEKDLTDAIIQMADDDLLRQTVGCAARQTVETEYSIDSIAKRYIQLYEILLAT